MCSFCCAAMVCFFLASSSIPFHRAERSAHALVVFAHREAVSLLTIEIIGKHLERENYQQVSACVTSLLPNRMYQQAPCSDPGDSNKNNNNNQNTEKKKITIHSEHFSISNFAFRLIEHEIK